MNNSVNASISKLFRVRKTVSKMLSKRGYAVKEEDMSMTLDTFLTTYCDKEGKPMMSSVSLASRRIDDNNERVVVFFIRSADGGKINASAFEESITSVIAEKIQRLILVFGNEITTDAKKKLLNHSTSDTIVEWFTEDELIVDITEHELVPEHVLLSSAQTQTLLKLYGLDERQLPRIQKQDPISRFYGAQKGQVFRIVRKSETAGKYVTYRIVV